MSIVKPIFCVLLLSFPAANAQPQSLSPRKATTAPLKALPVNLPKTKTKVYVSSSPLNAAAKANQSTLSQPEKSASPKVVQPRVKAARWHFSPKFEKGGKADSVFGMMLNHRF